MAEHINKEDSLNQGRVKLNKAITDANVAKTDAAESKTKSTQALANSVDTQQQLDNIILDDGTGNAEVIQARGNEPLLKDRLNKVDTQLAETAPWVKKGDLSKLIQTNGKKIVITGDSLSYNRYDFDPTTRANAIDCYPGMLSWSFMIRDLINRSDLFFKSTEELDFVFSDNSEIAINESAVESFLMPFNGQYLRFRTSDFGTAFVEFMYKHSNYETNKAYLYLTANPNDSACEFDVYIDGVFSKKVNNKPTSLNYQGFHPLVVELDIESGKNVKIEFKNFKQSATYPGNKVALYFHGVGSKHTPVFLTGQGGRTSAQVLNDIDNKVLQHSPDLLFLIVGANDIYQSVSVEDYKNNVEAIINATRADNESCEIVLLSSPKTMAYTYEEHQVYNNALHTLSVQHDCYYIDLLEVFRNQNVSEWRYDNVHLTKFGNAFLANYIVTNYFGSSSEALRFIDSHLYFGGRNTNVVIDDKPKIVTGCVYAVFNSASNSFALTDFFVGDKSVESVARQSDNLVRVHFSVDIKSQLNKFPVLQQYGRNLTKLLIVNPGNVLQSSNYIEYSLYKDNGAAVVASDWDTVNFNFMLNY